MATKKIQYLAGSLEPEIEARTGADESIAATARTMADRYADLMAREIPFFHIDEWEVIAEFADADDPQWPYHCRAAIAGGNDYPVTDRHGFVARLESLDGVGKMAALDLVERYTVGSTSLPGAE